MHIRAVLTLGEDQEKHVSKHCFIDRCSAYIAMLRQISIGQVSEDWNRVHNGREWKEGLRHPIRLCINAVWAPFSVVHSVTMIHWLIGYEHLMITSLHVKDWYMVRHVAHIQFTHSLSLICIIRNVCTDTWLCTLHRHWNGGTTVLQFQSPLHTVSI